MGDVLKLVPDQVGEDYRLPTDEVVEHLLDEDFKEFVVIGRDADGSVSVYGNSNRASRLFLLKQAELGILTGAEYE